MQSGREIPAILAGMTPRMIQGHITRMIMGMIQEHITRRIVGIIPGIITRLIPGMIPACTIKRVIVGKFPLRGNKEDDIMKLYEG